MTLGQSSGITLQPCQRIHRRLPVESIGDSLWNCPSGSVQAKDSQSGSGLATCTVMVSELTYTLRRMWLSVPEKKEFIPTPDKTSCNSSSIFLERFITYHPRCIRRRYTMITTLGRAEPAQGLRERSINYPFRGSRPGPRVRRLSAGSVCAAIPRCRRSLCRWPERGGASSPLLRWPSAGGRRSR